MNIRKNGYLRMLTFVFYQPLFLWRSLLILFFLLCFAIFALLRFLPHGMSRSPP